MSKSKFTKILVAVLSFCLILGTIFGVSAFAAETENSEAAAPKIISKNVEYGSKVYLYYAVPVASIPEADRVDGGVWLNVYDADGTLAFKQFAEEDTVDIYGDGTVCYIFKTRGVPAKELNTVEKVQVETKSGAKGEVESYSVEDYLYERLYNEGFATKTEADTGKDGKDYIRRGLYYNLLKYGAIAQELLAPGAEDKIGDTGYLNASNTYVSGGEKESGSSITLCYDRSKIDDFFAWEFTKYDQFGEIIESGYANDGSKFTIDGYFAAKPITFDGLKNPLTYDDADSISFINPTIGAVNSTPVGTVTWDEASNAVNINKTAKNQGINARFIKSATTTNANANAVIIEFDMNFIPASGSSCEFYLSIGPSGFGATNQILRYYLKADSANAGAGIKLKYEYYNNAEKDNNYNTISTYTGAKTGTSSHYKFMYVEGAYGETLIKFYVDGVLIHKSNVISGKNYNKGTEAPIDATKIADVNIQLGYSTTGSFMIDNAAITQVEVPVSEGTSYGAIDYVYDFTANNSLYSIGSSDAHAETVHAIKYDETDGNGYLSITKYDTKSGAGFQVAPTKLDDNPNVVRLKYDIYLTPCKDLSGNTHGVNISAEIRFGHTGYSNGSAQWASSIASINPSAMGLKFNAWNTVEYVYKVVETDASGNVTKAEAMVYVNGVAAPKALLGDANGDGIYDSATQFTVNGGSLNPIPEKMGIVLIRMNYTSKGEWRYDNVSYTLERE